MKIAELVYELSKLPPDMDVMVSTGRGLCHIESVCKRDRHRATPTGQPEMPYVIPGDGPHVHLPAHVDLCGRTLWFRPDPGYRLTGGRWPTKDVPWAKRVERIERERTLIALGGGRG